MIWKHPGVKNLKMLESVEATFLKEALRVSRFTKSGLAYVLAREYLLLKFIFWDVAPYSQVGVCQLDYTGPHPRTVNFILAAVRT
jgi:hypothetical protein